jgi:D-alanine-D-alanine ligase
MNAAKKNIALLAGGYSGEYAISIKSAITIEKNINPNLYQVYKIVISKEGWFYNGLDNIQIEVQKNDFSLAINGQHIVFDLVFFGIHGTPGEDGKLQGYFDMLGIPYTGCSALVSALTFNKIYCNRVVAGSNAAVVAPSMQLFKDTCPSDEEILKTMTLPCFVKPTEGGSSLGTNKVKTIAELRPAIDAAFAVDPQIMAEAFIKGRECTIGVYKTNGVIKVLPITEITTTNEFFDYEAKYQGNSEEITPADVPAYMQYKIEDSAKRVYQLFDCKGVVRIDFIFDLEAETLFFLEINTMPGQSEASIIPQQVRAAGGNLTDFYGGLIVEALK